MDIVADLLETQAVLISNPHSQNQDVVDLVYRRIAGYRTATTYCMVVYHCATNLLSKALEVTPGKRSPTITSLDDGAKSVSALVPKKQVNDIMDSLYDLGATDILVMDLSNSRM